MPYTAQPKKYKVLVIAPAWVGDLVMSQTLFKALKKQYKDALELDVFANSWTKGILYRMEEVDYVLDNPFPHGKLSLLKRINLGFKLRKKHYNQVIILPNSLKSAIVPFFAGIKKRTGFVGEFRHGLINDIYKLDKEQLPRMIDRFCALINSGNKPYKIDFPKLNVDIQNQCELIERFSINETKKIVAFCPAAEFGPAKRWLPEYFSQLADLLLEDGFTVLILGSKKDVELGDLIIHKAKKTNALLNLCGQTSLEDSVDILAMCSAVVTNDSGLMHIASAVDTKVIAIYGSSSPKFTPPLSLKVQIIQVPLECSPCFQRTCKYGHYNCLKFITPDVVYARILN